MDRTQLGELSEELIREYAHINEIFFTMEVFSEIIGWTVNSEIDEKNYF
jgi:hypothetical protein